MSLNLSKIKKNFSCTLWIFISLIAPKVSDNVLNRFWFAWRRSLPMWDKNFFTKTNDEGEVEPVSIEDKINRIRKQYEVTPRDDFNALVEGIGQGFTGAYTLGEALNKSAQARRQIIDPRVQRAQEISSKLDLLPIEQSYKEKLQAMKNKEKTYALTDKINQSIKIWKKRYKMYKM